MFHLGWHTKYEYLFDIFHTLNEIHSKIRGSNICYSNAIVCHQQVITNAGTTMLHHHPKRSLFLMELATTIVEITVDEKRRHNKLSHVSLPVNCVILLLYPALNIVDRIHAGQHVSISAGCLYVQYPKLSKGND